MKIVDDLRADLRSIENAIMAVECLAAIELGEDVSRKRGNRSPCVIRPRGDLTCWRPRRSKLPAVEPGSSRL
jgi:hypothetical protein